MTRVMSWAARTEQRKDAGCADIDGNIGATEDKLQGERLAAVTGRPAIQAGLPWMRRVRSRSAAAVDSSTASDGQARGSHRSLIWVWPT